MPVKQGMLPYSRWMKPISPKKLYQLAKILEGTFPLTDRVSALDNPDSALKTLFLIFRPNQKKNISVLWTITSLTIDPLNRMVIIFKTGVNFFRFEEFKIPINLKYSFQTK